jgi:hypothetical protein
VELLEVGACNLGKELLGDLATSMKMLSKASLNKSS